MELVHKGVIKGWKFDSYYDTSEKGVLNLFQSF